MTNIFMIERQTFVYEDHRGIDIYEPVLDPDLGWFKTRDLAVDAIVRVCTPSKKVFQQNEAQRKREWDRRKADWDKRVAVREALVAAGIDPRGVVVPWAANPGKFEPETFDPTPRGMENFDVVEIEPGQ